MKQVYGYPGAIYGSNNYTGEQSNAIYSTQSAWCVDGCDALGLSTAGFNVAGISQLTGAAAPYGYGSYGYGLTGAAAPYGYGSSFPMMTGAAAPCGGCQGGSVVKRPCDRGCGSIPIITGAACGCGLETGAAAPIYGGDAPCPITIQTGNSLDALKKTFVPFTTTSNIPPTSCGCGCGAAAPLINAFPDVPENYWAACPIDRLATNSVVVGYPDRTFKPGRYVSRAEFATMMVKGFNLNCEGLPTNSLFKDVPCSHWANPLIAKAVEAGILAGHPNGLFKPKFPVSRVEALTAMAQGIKCDISCDKAQQILSQYCDGNTVPSWAQIPVAKALDSGVLKTSLNPNQIEPCRSASRAEIASMLQTVRVAMGFDTNPTTACDCPKPADPCSPKTAYMVQDDCVKIPTLSLKFTDEINAKSSHVGQRFVAKTTEEVTINGKCYPCGSTVNGKIVEVVRPSSCSKGALKLAFLNIQDCGGCKADLPKQILTAQVNCVNNQNIFSRIIETPFTLVGGLVGTTARTVGGMIASLGNATENVSNDVGIALGDTLQGQLPAAGRSIVDAAGQTIMAPIDFTRTALAGTVGLFQTTGDEIAYLVDPNGSKISAVNPKEKVTIAFGCSGK